MTSEQTRPRRGKLLLSAAIGTAILAAGGAGYAIAQADGHAPPLSVDTPYRQPGFSALAKTVRPAVVNIATTQAPQVQQEDQEEDDQSDNPLQQFFGRGMPERPRATHALGSGFIVDPAGYIVTNNHVIKGATDIEVTLSDGSVHRARLVGHDPKTDLALLKISAGHSLPYVSFGDSDAISVGDWVIAAGNPYGLEGSVSAGIVSAKQRNINAGPYDDFLQIDAPINPGNSGGPLFDQSGHVVGIDTAIYSPSGGSVGIGFAIPSNVAARVVHDLRAHGRVARGWLGVEMQEITPELARDAGLSRSKGVIIAKVMPDSPADAGGIEQGDVIVSLNGKAIGTARDMALAVADAHAGEAMHVGVLRDGKSRTLDVTIAPAQG
jgi:serine protease Do